MITKEKSVMTERQAIIIYNLMGVYIDSYGYACFTEDYESEEGFLSQEIGLTDAEIKQYKTFIKENYND